MSGGGGGPIIINNLIENPSTTAEEKTYLRDILKQLRPGRALSRMERWRIAMLVFSVLGRQ